MQLPLQRNDVLEQVRIWYSLPNEKHQAPPGPLATCCFVAQTQPAERHGGGACWRLVPEGGDWLGA